MHLVFHDRFFFLFNLKLASFGTEPFPEMREEEEEKNWVRRGASRAATAIAEETQASTHYPFLFIAASF